MRCGSQIAFVPVAVLSDCMSVVRTCNLPKLFQLQPGRKFAGVRRAAMTSGKHCNIKSVAHVKAHRTDEELQMLHGSERCKAEANKQVDLLAKSAVSACHPPLSDSLQHFLSIL